MRGYTSGHIATRCQRMPDKSLMDTDARFYSELMHAYFNSTDDAIFVLCDEMKFIACNRATEQWLGKTEQELTRHNRRTPITELLGENYDRRRFSAYFRRALGGESVVFETLIQPPQSVERWVDINISRVRIEAGSMVIAVARDVSERKKHLATIAYQTNFDTLTQLPSRASLLKFLRQHQRGRAGDAAPNLTMYVLDLDRFKEINESLGQQVGDLVLQEVARRLQRMADTAAGDFLARLSGDAFSLVVRDSELPSAMLLARNIRQTVSRPVDIESGRISVDCGVGVAVWPDHTDDAEQLIEYAEAAMYSAKAAKTGVCAYAPGVSQTSAQRLQLVADLREAIEANAVSLCYQPIVGMHDGQVQLEALARWQHPQFGDVAPEQFVSLAEETGMINALTALVMDRAFAECATLIRDGVVQRLAVNVSAYCLNNPKFAVEVADSLQRHALSPDAVMLELTESAIMSAQPATQKTLAALRDTGVRLAIDDFGTGYSSLSKLRQLTLDELKIDKDFITDMQNNENDATIARATIEMAHSLGLQVVAEGVGDRAAWDMLKAMGCDYAQGYWLCRPLDIEALKSWRPPAR